MEGQLSGYRLHPPSTKYSVNPTPATPRLENRWAWTRIMAER